MWSINNSQLSNPFEYLLRIILSSSMRPEKSEKDYKIWIEKITYKVWIVCSIHSKVKPNTKSPRISCSAPSSVQDLVRKQGRAPFDCCFLNFYLKSYINGLCDQSHQTEIYTKKLKLQGMLEGCCSQGKDMVATKDRQTTRVNWTIYNIKWEKAHHQVKWGQLI